VDLRGVRNRNRAGVRKRLASLAMRVSERSARRDRQCRDGRRGAAKEPSSVSASVITMGQLTSAPDEQSRATNGLALGPLASHLHATIGRARPGSVCPGRSREGSSYRRAPDPLTASTARSVRALAQIALPIERRIPRAGFRTGCTSRHVELLDHRRSVHPALELLQELPVGQTSGRRPSAPHAFCEAGSEAAQTSPPRPF
jgi:hypothetical protein